MLDSVISGILYYFLLYVGPLMPLLLFVAHELADTAEARQASAPCGGRGATSRQEPLGMASQSKPGGPAAARTHVAPEAPVRRVMDAAPVAQDTLDRPVQSAPAVTDAVVHHAPEPQRRRRAMTNAERQRVYRMRHGDAHRAREAARKRAARAEQRSARLRAAELRERPEALAAA
jgi:hypothetical protein